MTTWAPGTPVITKESGSFAGATLIVVGFLEPDVYQVSVSGVVMNLKKDALLIDFDAVKKLSTSLGMTLITPQERDTLIRLLEVAKPIQGPLYACYKRLIGTRDAFLLLVRQSFMDLRWKAGESVIGDPTESGVYTRTNAPLLTVEWESSSIHFIVEGIRVGSHVFMSRLCVDQAEIVATKIFDALGDCRAQR